jgi:hypothetical protein
MLAIVFSPRKWRHFLQEVQHKTIVYSDNQNLTNFKTAVSLNRRQARWAEDLLSFDFDFFYRKGSVNTKADTLSRCPAFTSGQGGTTVAGRSTLLRKEQWLEVGDMQIDDKEIHCVNIGAMDIEQLLTEAKEWIKEKALLDESYKTICEQWESQDNDNWEYEIRDGILCWKNSVYVPDGLRERIIWSKHDSEVAGHF